MISSILTSDFTWGKNLYGIINIMINQKKIEKAVKDILLAIGEDPNRPGIKDTPKRVARMYAELFAGLHKDPGKEISIFHEEDHEEMVMVKDIPFYSMCEHHLVPFIFTL